MSPKKILRDMVPNEHRSVRAISVKEIKDEAEEDVESEKPKRAPQVRAKKSTPVRSEYVRKPARPSKPVSYKRSWMLVTFIVLVVCVGIIVAALSLVFSRGTIVIKPKTVSVAVSTSQYAKLNADLPQLAYQVITTTDSAKVSVPAIQKGTISKKSIGTVILYNSYATAPQKILINTRLVNTKGQIYRTLGDVSIPGQMTVAGKVKPGSVAVRIIADQPGAEYNASLVDLSGDFKIVAYKGSPKYDKIFGRMKTDITGGYVGKQVAVEANTQAAAEKNMKEQLTAKLIANAKALVPTDSISFDSGYDITFAPIESEADGTSNATIGLKAQYTAYVFKKDDLVRSFAKDQLAQFPANGYHITGLENLVFKQASSTKATTKTATKTTVQATSTLNFSLKGEIKIIGTIPVDNLKKELAGVAISNTGPILQRYGTVGGAYAKIFPVWMRSLPDSPDRITIELQSD